MSGGTGHRRVFKLKLGLTRTWMAADSPALENVGFCASGSCLAVLASLVLLSCFVNAGLRTSASNFLLSAAISLSRCLAAEGEWGSFLP